MISVIHAVDHFWYQVYIYVIVITIPGERYIVVEEYFSIFWQSFAVIVVDVVDKLFLSLMLIFKLQSVKN